jgi:hypothetical protein
MRLISLLRLRRTLIVVGIGWLGVGFLPGRFVASASRPHDVSFASETYHRCISLYRDVAGCAEVTKSLAGNRAEVN